MNALFLRIIPLPRATLLTLCLATCLISFLQISLACYQVQLGNACFSSSA